MAKGLDIFGDVTISGLTASKIIFTDADKTLISGNTDVTPAELEELTDGSATVLHSHAGGGGSMTTVKEGGVQLGDADIVTLDFDGNDFNLTEDPNTEVNIIINDAGIDHGSISGLADDDHTGYHTDARAATWLAANHETTYTHADIALNTTHRGLVAGNPHNVTPTELSLVIGTDVQAYDAGLTSLAGLVYASDSFIKVTATDTYAIRTIAETKTDLSLNLVENTALSTWAGTTNITTLGTIGTGTWQGTSISTTYTDAKCVTTWPDTYTSNQNLQTTDGPTFAGLTLSDDLVFSAVKGIRSNTSDANDNSSVYVAGGGAFGNTRGACLVCYGNEVGEAPGKLYLYGGNVTDGDVIFNVENSERGRFRAEGLLVTGGLTLTGNIIMPDGGTIGQAAGPLLTFDDSNDYLGITGCKVGIGTTAPSYPLTLITTETILGGMFIQQLSDSSHAPRIVMRKERTTGQSAQDNDYCGEFYFQFYNDAVTPELITGASFRGKILDVSDGTEDVAFEIRVVSNSLTLLAAQFRDGSLFLPSIKSGANQAAAGAAATELWHDTTDNTIKIGV